MSSLTKIEMKLNKLSNDLNIKLIEGTNGTITSRKDYINNGENLKIKPKARKSKHPANGLELSFGIFSFSSSIDIEAMNIISSDVQINEYQLLGVKSDELVNALKQLGKYTF